jgi:hypothetical protein
VTTLVLTSAANAILRTSMACATRIVVDLIFVTTNVRTSAARNVLLARSIVHRNVLTPYVPRNAVKSVINAQSHVLSNASIVLVRNSVMNSVIESLAKSLVIICFYADTLALDFAVRLVQHPAEYLNAKAMTNLPLKSCLEWKMMKMLGLCN